MFPRLLQTLLIDFPLNMLNELLEQPLVMKGFLALGWLCFLVMLTSIISGF